MILLQLTICLQEQQNLHFFTGIQINNCNIKYNTTALSLNGSFTVDNNTFNRMSGSNVVNVIKVYSTRSSSSISSNTFNDSGPVQYIIYFTSSNESGLYSDMCNSKGGTLTINSNNVSMTHTEQSTTFIYFDYFNKYSMSTLNYNINTKLGLNVTNNTLTLITKGKFIVLMIINNLDLNMFNTCNINTNNINNTQYGIIHLDKLINSTVITIQSDELTRSLFKVYSNILDTADILYPFITNNSNYIPKIWLRSISGITYESDNIINSWIDVIGNKTAIAYTYGSVNKPIVDSTSEPFISINSGINNMEGNYFDLGQMLFQFSRGMSFIGVINFTKNTNLHQRVFDFGNGTPGNNMLLFDNGGFFSVQHFPFWPGYTFIMDQQPIVYNTWYILGIIFSNSKFEYYINNTNKNSLSVTSGTILQDSTLNKTLIGRSLWNSASDIGIKEFIFYDKEMSNVDMESIITQLKYRYTI